MPRRHTLLQHCLTPCTVLLVVMMAALASQAEASSPSVASWTSLNPGVQGASNAVKATAMDSQGALYMGGYFTVVGTTAASHIAKWSGSAWSALGSGVDGDVYALAFLGNDLYVGGSFSHAGGVVAANIAKWDGKAWSAVGTGTGTVNALLVVGS